MNIPVMERSVVRNMRVHVLPTDRFKTYAVSVHIGRKLREDKCTSTALIPFVLRRGNMKYPETQSFREKLDDLYGAGFGFDIVKRGDYQIVQFRIDMIRESFVQENNSLLKEALQFLGDTITRPLLENGSFRPAYVEAEKYTLQKRIESLINDKIRYAAERCVEEMCADEPYRLHPLGRIDDLASITPASLYAAYVEWLKEAAIDIYVAGDTTADEVSAIVSEAFACGDGEPQTYQHERKAVGEREVRTVIDRLDVTQGKLNFGLRLPVTHEHEHYPHVMVYNGILGSYPHSKLFINVREKANLAYYAASRLEGHKGIMTIQSGIEFSQFEQAKDIILQQLDSIAAGEISDQEFSQTKTMLTSNLKELLDSAFDMMAFDFNNTLSGAGRTITQLIEHIQHVTKADIQSVARGVKLDTIYFLRDRQGGDTE